MLKKAGLFFLVFIGLYALLFLFTNSVSFSEEAVENELNNKKVVYKTPNVPSEISFAGESVPLSKFDVYESLDNEILSNAFWQSQVFRFLKRAQRYFPIIEPILKKNHIPDDFKYLAVAESGLTNAISPSKAKGFWQFLKGKGKEYNLVINKYIDERYHLEKSTQAACDYFNKAYEKFHNWTLVAASYNMGMNGLERAIRKQKVDSYYDLILNRETARYVYRIVAIKTIMQSPRKYGYIIKNSEKYSNIPYHTVKVDSSLNDLSQWALQQGANYKMLRLLNPWLISNQLPNTSQKSYDIKLPELGFRKCDD